MVKCDETFTKVKRKFEIIMNINELGEIIYLTHGRHRQAHLGV